MSSSADYEDKREKTGAARVNRVEVESLDPSWRGRLRESLGQDPGAVAIHTGPAAQAEAERQGARALTRGKDIYFAREEYQAASEAGQRLLIHELAHTLQQTGAGTQPESVQNLEAEADLAAEAVLQGGRVQITGQAQPGQAQLQEKGKAAVPSLKQHPEEILPTPGRGLISAPGLTIPYQFTVAPGAAQVSLALQVPEGVAVAAIPLTALREGVDFRIQNAGGTRARSVMLLVSNKVPGPPRLQVTFTRGSAGYIVVFQFPAAARK